MKTIYQKPETAALDIIPSIAMMSGINQGTSQGTPGNIPF